MQALSLETATETKCKSRVFSSNQQEQLVFAEMTGAASISNTMQQYFYILLLKNKINEFVKQMESIISENKCEGQLY